MVQTPTHSVRVVENLVFFVGSTFLSYQCAIRPYYFSRHHTETSGSFREVAIQGNNGCIV